MTKFFNQGSLTVCTFDYRKFQSYPQTCDFPIVIIIKDILLLLVGVFIVYKYKK